MHAKEAYTLTQQGLLERDGERRKASMRNVGRLSTIVIPTAAKQGYGSVCIDTNTLLADERQVLKMLGYKVRYSNGGEWGSPYYKIVWDRKSPKQDFPLASLTDDNKLESLPN